MEVIEELTELNQNKTFKLDMNNNKMVGTCTDLEALKMSVYCILGIAKDKYPIYSFEYGSRLEELIGEPIPIAVALLEYYIKEALTKDDRIIDVTDFEYNVERNKVYASFTVVSDLGEFNAESVVNI